MRIERVGDHLVFRAGRGEWYNQPHESRWDMGEDAADIPAAGWHVDLDEALTLQDPCPPVVAVEVTEMDWLVGQDLGFLLRLSERLSRRGVRLVVVGTERVVRAAQGFGLDKYLQLSTSLEDVSESG